MYDSLIDAQEFSGVIYIIPGPAIEELVRRIAQSTGPDPPAN